MPKVFQQFPALVRKSGASGLMVVPDERDVYEGQTAEDVVGCAQSKSRSGADRVKLFRLAFDAATSSLAGRQVLWEYYFFGGLARIASAYVDTEVPRERVVELLERD